jgi:hypothetical protein
VYAAVSALDGFRHAEKKHQTQLIDEADLIVEKAMKSFKFRYRISIFSSIVFNCLLFNIVWMQFQLFVDQHLL